MVILFTFWYILGWQFPTWLWVLSGIFFTFKLRRSVNRIISGIRGESVKSRKSSYPDTSIAALEKHNNKYEADLLDTKDAPNNKLGENLITSNANNSGNIITYDNSDNIITDDNVSISELLINDKIVGTGDTPNIGDIVQITFCIGCFIMNSWGQEIITNA